MNVPYIQLEERCASCLRHTLILRARIAEAYMKKEGLINDNTTMADIMAYVEAKKIETTVKCTSCIKKEEN
jgi:hypothetical protein